MRAKEIHDHQRPDPEQWRYAVVVVAAWTAVLIVIALL